MPPLIACVINIASETDVQHCSWTQSIGSFIYPKSQCDGMILFVDRSEADIKHVSLPAMHIPSRTMSAGCTCAMHVICTRGVSRAPLDRAARSVACSFLKCPIGDKCDPRYKSTTTLRDVQACQYVSHSYSKLRGYNARVISFPDPELQCTGTTGLAASWEVEGPC